MNNDEELLALERRLQLLQQEEVQRADAVELACRARLASPSALFTAGVTGAVLGMLGGKRGRDEREHETKPQPAVAGNAWLGALFALAGVASAAVRILELGALIKAEKRRD